MQNSFLFQEINSKENQHIKFAVSLHNKKTRKEKKLCILEGKTLIDEAIKRNLNIQQVFATNAKYLLETNLDADIEKFIISEELMDKIASTENPPPLMAIAKLPETDSTIKGNFFLYGDNIQDPGNLGSIIRTAFACGINNIFLSPNSVDIFNSKTIRSSMGTVFCGSIEYLELDDLIARLEDKSNQENSGLEIIGTSSYADTDYTEFKLNAIKNILLIVGNESHGISQAALDRCSLVVKIVLENNVESLNVLAASSILMFDIKQKIKKNGNYHCA